LQHVEAEQATVDFLQAEKANLIQMINTKVSLADLQKHLKIMLNEYAVANGIPQSDALN